MHWKILSMYSMFCQACKYSSNSCIYTSKAYFNSFQNLSLSFFHYLDQLVKTIAEFLHPVIAEELLLLHSMFYACHKFVLLNALTISSSLSVIISSSCKCNILHNKLFEDAHCDKTHFISLFQRFMTMKFFILALDCSNM